MKKTLLLLCAIFIGAFTYSLVKAQDVVNLGVSDSIITPLRTYTGNNIVLVIPNGYTNPIYSTTDGTPSNIDLSKLTNLTANTKITIKGDGTMPTLKLKLIALPGVKLKFAFKDLTITGATADPTTNYVFNQVAANPCELDSVVFDNCDISTFRSLVRFQSTAAIGSETQKANNIVINNCIVHNFADYGVVYNSTTGGFFGPVKAYKSTFYGFGATVFMLQKNATSIDISDCTFDNVVGASGKAIVDLSTLAKPVTITNCILGKTQLASGGLTIKTGGTLIITNCYKTTDWTANDPTASGGITGAFTAYSGASSDLFTTVSVSTAGSPYTTTIGNYKIKDASFVGKNSVGDPRWYYDTPSNVINPNSAKKIISVQNYDILGKQVSKNAKGMIVQKVTYDDGTTSTLKSFVKSEK